MLVFQKFNRISRRVTLQTWLLNNHIFNIVKLEADFSYMITQIFDERHSPRTSSNVLGKQPKEPSLRISRSYTRVSPTESQRLISVKSEGPYTVRKNVNVGEIARESLIASRENLGTIDTFDMDYSSDEFGA